MKQINLKEKIPIHSACLFYDKEANRLLAYGGTNQNSSMEAYLYWLELNNEGEENGLEWKKKLIKNVPKQGVLWQHTCNIYNQSLFNSNNQGKFMLVVGGCRFPWSPYKSITEINLNSFQVTGSIDLQEAVVAHESVYDSGACCVYVLGGANGGGFNRWIYKIKQGKIEKIQGHNAVGGSAVLTPLGLVVYGGVCGPEMLNDMIIYH